MKLARVVNVFQKTLTGGRYESNYPMQELWR